MAARKARSRKPGGAAEAPVLFRLTVEVGDLKKAAKFYESMLGVKGRVLPGSRCYFACGPVTLQVLDVSSGGKPHPAAKSLYFTVKDLEAAHARARSLRCLSRESVHGEPGGEIHLRPWGERSFYVEDPWDNPLCFVEAGTVYEG